MDVQYNIYQRRLGESRPILIESIENVYEAYEALAEYLGAYGHEYDFFIQRAKVTDLNDIDDEL